MKIEQMPIEAIESEIASIDNALKSWPSTRPVQLVVLLRNLQDELTARQAVTHVE